MFELVYKIDLKKEKYPFSVEEISKEIFSGFNYELLKSNKLRMELYPVFDENTDILRYLTISLPNTVATISKINLNEDGKIYLNIVIDKDRKEIYDYLKSGELIIKIRSMTTSLMDNKPNFKLIGFDIIKKEDI